MASRCEPDPELGPELLSDFRGRRTHVPCSSRSPETDPESPPALTPAGRGVSGRKDCRNYPGDRDNLDSGTSLVEKIMGLGESSIRKNYYPELQSRISELELLAAELYRQVEEKKQVQRELTRLNQELERRVAQRTAQLEATNGELLAFTYSVTHDLRAPLRAIQNFGEMLRRKHAVTEDAESLHFTERIVENAKRLERFANDLLALSRAGQKQIKRSKFNPLQLALEVAAEYAPEYPSSVVEVESDGGAEISADSSLIRQVWVNLVGNALKYSSRVASPHILISAELRDEEVEFRVSDNGAGFPMEQASRLFGVFQRLHDEKEFEGSGVGLAIVKRIVTRHGGRVSAFSRSGEGSGSGAGAGSGSGAGAGSGSGAVSGSGEGAVFSFSLPREV